jgi:serine/alanine adding enzyme
MSLQIVHTLPVAHWRTFVDEHPKGNIFHTPEMFEVYRRAQGHFPELWAAVDDENILALMLPVHITLMGGLFRLLTTRSIIFGGCLCLDSYAGHSALKKMLAQYQARMKNRSLFTEIRNLASLDDTGPILTEAGFEYEAHLNYLIKLESRPENVFSRIGARTRQHIRQSLRRNEVQVEEVTARERVAACYELLGCAYRKARVPLADISLFHAAFAYLCPRQMARFTLACVGNEPAASSIELLYKDVIYGWYGGLNRKFIAQVPNEALMWNILEWGCQNNYHVYDFGGAGKPTEKYGVRDFKAKFGGELVCFGRNTWVANPLLMDFSKFAYGVLRKFIF